MSRDAIGIPELPENSAVLRVDTLREEVCVARECYACVCCACVRVDVCALFSHPMKQCDSLTHTGAHPVQTRRGYLA